jgi:hypothetical protein
MFPKACGVVCEGNIEPLSENPRISETAILPISLFLASRWGQTTFSEGRNRRPSKVCQTSQIGLDQIVNTANDLAPRLAPKHGQLHITTVLNGQPTHLTLSETLF